ncbi:MAG TPA: recombinase RecQ [Oceanospirillaceae bacterium]|nr:recombinase RecQ [Oceanospirillaceae bacterium]
MQHDHGSSHESLKDWFGFDQFRAGQEQTIKQLLSGQSSLAIFPTGSGKSLCYQYTAMMLPHLTLVVSPLLALMKDQREFLAAKGIPAASIDSTLTREESRQVMNDVRGGKIKILMVSVERFKNERFRQFISSIDLSMLVVDEAHCISEWGHNFRPDYLKLPSYCAQLGIPLVLLLTATATASVKQDMANKFGIADEHIVQTGFYRHNLDLDVLPITAAQRDSKLLAQLQQYAQDQATGIVYVTLQHTAETVAAYLQAHGIRAAAYHAGFDNDKRQQIQFDFMAGNYQLVVATIAFGMGIDKANIRFVIHYDLPKSIENYSQEIGRAGRDGQPAKCTTFANLDGLNTLENFVYGDTPELTYIQMLVDTIRQESQSSRQSSNQNVTWELQIAGLSNHTNIRQLPLKTLLVQLELGAVLTPLYSYFADFRYKFLCPQEHILSLFEGERLDFLTTLFSLSNFKKVWGSPDFEMLFETYGYDRQRVIAALEYLQDQACIELQTTRMTDVFAVNLDVLNQPSLVANLHAYFVAKEDKEIQRIAALIEFFESPQCLSQNLAHYFDDQAVPQHCGHCSVCRGQVAKLPVSPAKPWPAQAALVSALSELHNHLASKTSLPLSTETRCRFLVGVMTPLFSRNKVRQLPGFGMCADFRYSDIRHTIKTLADSS